MPREPQTIDCVGKVGKEYFTDWVFRLNAVKVKVGMLKQGEGRLPSAFTKPDNYIWYETSNYGIIMSQVENGRRRVVLRV